MSEPTAGSPPSFAYSPRIILVLAFAAGLILSFLTPWVANFDRSFSPFTLQKNSQEFSYLWIITLCAIFTIAVHRNPAVLNRVGTLTALITWGTVFFFVGKNLIVLTALKWGASFTLFCALGVFTFAAERQFALPLDLVAKKLGSRKAEVYSHWGTFTPDIHFSSQDFYRILEETIRLKQWPGVSLIRVEYAEAGLLSHKREYLRIMRQRQIFDVCAATFGTDYFFSLREAHFPPVINTRAILSVLIGLAILSLACINLLGLLFGMFSFIVLLAFGVWFLFNILRMGLTKVDSLLLTLPVLGPLYEVLFRPDTYFQQDTRLIFINAVSELVKKQVEETTSAKGLRFLDCFEKKPVLGGLYSPHTLRLKTAA